MAYEKTEWVPFETLVSADKLNKIENQLQSVTSIAEANEVAIRTTDTEVKVQGKVFEETITSHANENASLATKGHVQLSSATNSEDETVAATSKAVKAAMDQANAAFQSASDGKTLIASAITGKGILTNPDEHFSTMANKISQIKVGNYSVGDIVTKDKFIKNPTVWSFPMGNASAIAHVDSNGYVYAVSWDKTVRKITPNGEQVWSFTGHVATTLCVTTDSNGNVYSGGASSDRTVRKINPNGVQVWSFTGHTNAVRGVATDSSGNVFSCSEDKTVRKINSNGEQVWYYDGHDYDVNAVVVDSDGSIYSGSLDGTVQKITPVGGRAWSAKIGVGVYSLALDGASYVYCGDANGRISKINKSSGSPSWTNTIHLSRVNGLCVSSNDIYTASQDNTALKIDSNGKLVDVVYKDTSYIYTVNVYKNNDIVFGVHNGSVMKLKNGIQLTS